MTDFFDHCEQHWREMEHNASKADEALGLFARAKLAVPEESIYGRRIQLIDNYLNGLRAKAKQLAQKRGVKADLIDPVLDCLRGLRDLGPL